MRKKRILAWLIVAAASALVAQALVRSQSSAAPPRAEKQAPAQPQAAAQRLAALPVREPIAEFRGELFAPRSWAADSPAPALRSRSKSAAKPSAPSAPAMPYRVAGQVMHEGGMRVVLAKGNRIHEVREGDLLEDGYRVESIRPDAVTLVYLPLGRSEQLRVSGPALHLERNNAESFQAQASPNHTIR